TKAPAQSLARGVRLGARTGVRRTRTPSRTRPSSTSFAKMLSRSWMRSDTDDRPAALRGTVAVHSAVGWSRYVLVDNPARSNLYDDEGNVAVITTKKSQATMVLAWLRRKVSQRCFGSGVRTGPSLRRYLPMVRGETRMPSLSFNSLAMRSSPQVGFS